MGTGDKQVKDGSRQTRVVVVRVVRHKWIPGVSKKYSLWELVIKVLYGGWGVLAAGCMGSWV